MSPRLFMDLAAYLTAAESGHLANGSPTGVKSLSNQVMTGVRAKRKSAGAFRCDNDRRGRFPDRPTHGSFFSGIGMLDFGLEMAGFRTTFQVEVNPCATAVLEKRWPGVRRSTDVRQCNNGNLPRVHILSGGFPCQQISIAGRQEGIGTEEDPTDRSGLWFQFLRLIKELRPFWALIKNVDPLLRTSDGDTVLDGLDRAQYDSWPLVMAAEDLGAPHQRKRTFILARYRNAVELPPVAESRHNVIGALDAARAEWLRIKQELRQVRQPPANPEAAYAKIV